MAICHITAFRLACRARGLQIKIAEENTQHLIAVNGIGEPLGAYDLLLGRGWLASATLEV